MYVVEICAAIRRFVLVEGNSRREAARVFGISRPTVDTMCAYSAPPGYQRTKPPAKPKLDPFISIIDVILKAESEAPKQNRNAWKQGGRSAETIQAAKYLRELARGSDSGP